MSIDQFGSMGLIFFISIAWWTWIVWSIRVDHSRKSTHPRTCFNSPPQHNPQPHSCHWYRSPLYWAWKTMVDKTVNVCHHSFLSLSCSKESTCESMVIYCWARVQELWLMIELSRCLAYIFLIIIIYHFYDRT